jgi:ribonuclease P protein component
LLAGQATSCHPSRLPAAPTVIYTFRLPQGTRFNQGAGIFHAETYIFTQPAEALESTRVPHPHEDQERSRGVVASPGQGTQARRRKTGFPRVVSPVMRAVRPSFVQDYELVSTGAPDRSGEQRVQPAQPGGGASFPRAARLLKHADFERVYKQGRRHFSSHMTVFYLRQAEGIGNGNNEARTGFTVGRVLGGAVQRNRIKRRMRNAVRQRRALLQGPVDIVINPKKSVLNVEFPILLEEVTRAFEMIARRMAERTTTEK